MPFRDSDGREQLCILRPGDLVEVQGSAGSGKTFLLNLLALECVLPHAYMHSERPISGKRSVIVFDCDGRWDARRLEGLFMQRLNSKDSQGPGASLASSSSIPRILERIHVFKPTSLLSLALTLLGLDHYHASQMRNEYIGLIIIDSLSTFYWRRRWDIEQHSQTSDMHDFMSTIRNLRERRRCVVAISNWGLFPSKEATSGHPSTTPSFRQHFGLPYPQPPKPSQDPVSSLQQSWNTITHYVVVDKPMKQIVQYPQVDTNHINAMQHDKIRATLVTLTEGSRGSRNVFEGILNLTPCSD